MIQDDLSWESEGPQTSGESPAVERDASATSDPEVQAFEAFIGPNNRGYYMNQYLPIVQSMVGATKFNWAAFFLTGIWMGYRKMYVSTAVFYGVLFAITMVEKAVIGTSGPGRAVGSFIGILVAVICGAYGTRWYMSHIRGRIHAARSQGHEGNDLTKMLEKRGGTSVVASLGMLGLFIGLRAAVDFFGSLEFQSIP